MPDSIGTIPVTLGQTPGQWEGILSGNSGDPTAWSGGLHAVITAVANPGGPEFSLSHTDRLGRGGGFVILRPGYQVHEFDGLEVEGSWTAQLSGPVESFPPTVGVLVSWNTSSPPPPPQKPPSASFKVTPVSGFAPLYVVFDASASSAPDGTIVKCSWDCGDGTPVFTGRATRVGHTFNSAGSYWVTLRVTDNLGAQGLTQRQVTVTKPVPPIRIDDRGAFNTLDLRPWNQPQPDNRAIVTFAQPFSGTPNVPIGLASMDIDHTANVRIGAAVEQVDQEHMQINIGSWADTILYAGSCAWIEIQPEDSDIQSGQFNTTEDHPWNKPQANTARRIDFPRPYVQTPHVIVWLNLLDMSCAANWRVSAYATDVTPTGFTLHLDTWADSVLYAARAAWVAHSAGSQIITSGSFNTNDVRAWDRPQLRNSGAISFPYRLSQSPRVTVGLNSIDVYCKSNLRIAAAVSDASETGMTWHLDSWADTVLYSAGGSYIATPRT